MSKESCGVVVYEWEHYWLRDDRATGICQQERYSLFSDEPYGRLAIYTGPLDWALKTIKKEESFLTPFN